MRKLLIAEHSDILIKKLETSLYDSWDIHFCTDTYPVFDLLQYLKPDAMVIDLGLPPKGGLAILEECQSIKPPIILATTDILSPSIISTSENLSVNCLVRLPYSSDYIKQQLEELYNTFPKRSHEIEWHLRFLGLNPALSGYRCLLAIIPFYKSNPNLLLKEVYYSVASNCGFDDIRNMDRAVRTVVNSAWKKRRLDVWSRYFPVNEQRDVNKPSNKEFIKSIIEKL